MTWCILLWLYSVLLKTVPSFQWLKGQGKLRCTWDHLKLLYINIELPIGVVFTLLFLREIQKEGLGDSISPILLVPGSSQTALHSCLALLAHTCNNNNNNDNEVYAFWFVVS